MLNTSSSTILTVLTTTTSTALVNPSGNLAEVSTAFLAVSPSQGQSLFTQPRSVGSGGGEVPETEQEAQQGESAPPWSRYVLGVDELFEQIRQENQNALFHDDGPAKTDEGAHHDLFDLFGAGLQTPPLARPQVSPLGFSPAQGDLRSFTRRGQRPAPNSAHRESLQIGNALPAGRHAARAVDEAIEALTLPTRLPSADSASAASLPQDQALVWTSLVCSSMIIVRTNPPVRRCRPRSKRAGSAQQREADHGISRQ
jgi:hypothetical protein